MWYNRFNLLTESREEIGRRFINAFIKEQKEDLRTFLDKEFDYNVEDLNWILKITVEEEKWPSWVIVKVLMESGAELQVLNDLGQTAIHIAAKNGCDYIVQLLFEYSGDENRIDDEGFSYLHAACMYGLDEVVQRLIDHGANINVKTFYKNGCNESLLSLCLERGYLSTVEILLKNVANLKLLRDWHKNPLSYLKCTSYQYNWNEFCRWKFIADQYFEELLKSVNNSGVIENLSDSDDSDAKGFTLFHAACICGNAEMVQKFIDQKIDLDLLWSGPCYKASPLTLAIKYKQIEVVEMLLKNGANISMKLLGKNPLHTFFLEFNNDPADSGILELLIAYKCDVNEKDDENRSPLFRCYESCSRDAHYHGDGSCASEGCIPNGKATIKKLLGDLKSLETLLKNKANVNEVFTPGQSILHLFITSKEFKFTISTVHVSIIKTLLKYGADINAKDANGDSPLHSAVIRHNLDVVKLLLRRGADVQSVDLSKLHWTGVWPWLDKMIEFFLILDCLNSEGYKMDESSCLAVMKYLIDATVIDCEIRFECYDDELFTGSSEQIRLYLRCAESESRNHPLDCWNQTIVSGFYRDLLIVEKGNMFIKREMKDCLRQLLKMFVVEEEYVLEYHSKIPEQIEKLKKLKIKYGLSLFDICSFGSEKGHYLLTNPKLWTVINLPKMEIEFHSIFNIIKIHMLTCFIRKFFVDIGLKYVILLTQDKLPLLCCERIIQYLSNEDIFYLCRAYIKNNFLPIEFQCIAENCLLLEGLELW